MYVHAYLTDIDNAELFALIVCLDASAGLFFKSQTNTNRQQTQTRTANEHEPEQTFKYTNRQANSYTHKLIRTRTNKRWKSNT